MNRSFCRLLLVLALTLSAVSSASQSNSLATLAASPHLRQITGRAGLIFTGQVLAVAPIRPDGSDQISSIEITFQVEQGLRRPKTGQRFSIHEWPGLWRPEERYRVGQRMMIFLYPPSSLGFTSPVSGSAGRCDIDRDGQISVKPVHLPIPPTGPRPIRAPADPRVPLRTFSRAIRQLMEESR
jgi:hypothetical protein